MKKKLFAAATSLAMAFVMLTSASFAWFTISKSGEVTSINVTMEATKNLEIARATTNSKEPEPVSSNDSASETNWGSIITSFEATVDFPATSADGLIKTVQYDASGRTNGLIAASTPSDLTDGVGYYECNVLASGTDTKTVAAVFGVWLRSNETLKDVVATATNIASGWNCSFADSDGNVISGDISLTANTAKLIWVVVYLDGESTDAKAIASPTNLTRLKVTFTSASIT